MSDLIGDGPGPDRVTGIFSRTLKTSLFTVQLQQEKISVKIPRRQAQGPQQGEEALS